jgi:hypothetical protein
MSSTNNYLTARATPHHCCNLAGSAASTATAEPATNVTRDHNREQAFVRIATEETSPQPCKASGITGTGVSSRIRVIRP